ncbi:MAG TPA: CII family transcriptional regulator [Ramlibacter sp.]|uniref:CII family transcriptional regulator n=1 Tax=Ramlibacter sp. TaxID=1917967 RepID=UPI002ED661CC
MPPDLTPQQRARKNEQVILHALADTGQSEVARAMGVAESTISRFKDGGIGQAAQLLAHIGLKVVPAGVQCFDPVYVEALRELAKHGVDHGPRSVDWSDVQ